MLKSISVFLLHFILIFSNSLIKILSFNCKLYWLIISKKLESSSNVLIILINSKYKEIVLLFLSKCCLNIKNISLYLFTISKLLKIEIILSFNNFLFSMLYFLYKSKINVLFWFILFLDVSLIKNFFS